MIDRKKRNENILNGCANVFYEKGIEKATMRSFSDELGYSPATIYQSYKDKHEIVENCLRYCVEHRGEIYDRVFAGNEKKPKKVFSAIKKEKEELLKLNVVIARILTSPGYNSMSKEVQAVENSMAERSLKNYDKRVASLFTLYIGALNIYSVNGNDDYFQQQEEFIKSELEKCF